MSLDLRARLAPATAPAPQGGVRSDRYYCEWGAVVGGRIRRLRRHREWTLQDLGRAIARADGGNPYTGGFVSRLERGRASAPLYVYLAIADAFGVDAGRLLGPESAAMEVTEAETVLLRCMRDLGIEPHEAILMLSAPRA